MEILMARRIEQQAVGRSGSYLNPAIVRRVERSYRFVGIIAAVLSISGSVFGQFVISPLKLDDIQLQSGKTLGKVMSIENMTSLPVDQVDLTVSDVVQDSNGTWTPVQPGDPNVDWNTLRSCAKWVTLDRQQMRLAPFQKATFNLQVKTPSRQQGHYAAAVTAKATLPAGSVEGYESAVAIEYVIPILVEIQARPLRNQVELADVGLMFQPQSTKAPAATMATLSVNNKGGTFCRIQGYVRISNWWGGHWRRMTESQFSDIGVLPGNKLVLKQDVGRSLPEGKYKLEGFLVVNGAPADQIIKDSFEYGGDPREKGKELKGLSALDFDPQEVTVDATVGSLRTAKIQIVNTTDEPVTVNADTALPDHLNALVVTDPNTQRQITGEEYGCNKWITVEPGQFQLGAYGRQNVFLKINVPDTATGLPNYYSVINLRCQYPDGTPAGTARSRVCLSIKKANGAPKLKTNSVLIADLSPTKVQILVNTRNEGTKHALPSCYVAVLNSTGQVVRRVQMSSASFNQGGLQLPLEVRRFAGALDFSGLAAGQYRLGVSLETDNYPAEQSQTGLIIKESNGTKTVEVVGLGAVGGAVKAKF